MWLLLFLILAVTMSDFEIIVPEAGVNYFSDPGFDLADPDTEWTITGNGGAPDVTRATNVQWVRAGCALVDMDVGGGGTLLDIYQNCNPPGTAVTISARVRRATGGVVTSAHALLYYGGVSYLPTIVDLGDGWYEISRADITVAPPANFGVRAFEDGLYIDGVQLEATAYMTTYIDGDQPGCEWTGGQYVSASNRSALSRAGGRALDILDDLDFRVELFIGGGLSPRMLHLQGLALQPGELYKSTKIQGAIIQLTGIIAGSSLADLHNKRETLIDALAPIDDILIDQPTVFRYSGSNTRKQIGVYYDSGFSANLDGCNQEMQITLRLIAPSPFWYAMDDAVQLDVEDTLPLVYVVGRVDGEWTGLGPPNAPGGASVIYATAVDPSTGDVYFGGDFTNWDGDANQDYITRWSKANQVWEQVGGAGAVNGVVSSLLFAPDGTLYLGGAFTNLGGANGDHFASYDVGGDAFSDIVAGATVSVDAFAWGHDDKLYIGGAFINWGDANGDYIVSWDGAALASLGSPPDAYVADLATDLDGNIIVVGNFSNAGGAAALKAAKWDVSAKAWSQLGSGLNNLCESVAIASDGKIYVGGAFTQDGDGNTLTRIGFFNGSAYEAMSTGVNNGVETIAVAPDGDVYIGGVFTTAGGAHLANRAVRWNGYAFAHLDITLFGGTVRAMITTDPDPVVESNYDLYFGFNASGNAKVSGTATPSSTIFLPIITVNRAGGTSAKLAMIRNETTGKELLFDYALVDGDTLTIDTRQDRQTINSNYWGNRLDALLPASDLGDFWAVKGENLISAYVITAGAPTITAQAWWPQTFPSADD